MDRERRPYRALKLNQRRRELLKALGLAGLGFGLGMLAERAIAHPQIERYYLHKYSGVEPYSYTVFREGDMYYAKNGKTGEVFEDDDASEVIQSALNSIERGIVYVKCDVELYSGIHIGGWKGLVFEWGRRISLKSDLDTPVIYTHTSQPDYVANPILLKNVWIGGGGHTVPEAIRIHAWNSVIEDINIVNISGTGLLLQNAKNNTVVNTKLRNIRIVSVDGIALDTAVATDFQVEQLELNGTTGWRINAVRLEGSDIHIYGGDIGIHLQGAKFTKLTNVQLSGMNTAGIYSEAYNSDLQIKNLCMWDIKGKLIHLAGISTRWAGGLEIDGLKIVYEDVDPSSKTVPEIHLQYPHDPVIIKGIWSRGGWAPTFVTVENPQTGYELRLEGERVSNKGIATFSGDGSTTTFNIEHGLVSTPSKYGVTPLTPDADASRTITVDDTYITITFDTAPPSGTDNVKFGWWAEV